MATTMDFPAMVKQMEIEEEGKEALALEVMEVPDMGVPELEMVLALALKINLLMDLAVLMKIQQTQQAEELDMADQVEMVEVVRPIHTDQMQTLVEAIPEVGLALE